MAAFSVFRVRFALSALLVGFLSSALAGAEGRFLEPRAGAVLESGATARVAWNLSEMQDREPDEMELVLSVDGGRTFPVRITRDLDPGTRSFAWRVPALPTAQAQLALRAGEDGDERIELVGEGFSIVLGPCARLEPTVQVGGEWRTEDALDGDSEHPLALPASLAGAPGTIGSVPQLPPADAPRPSLALLTSPFHNGGVKAATSPAANQLSPALPRTPTAAPMRA